MKMGDEGLEQPSDSAGKTPLVDASGAESGAVGAADAAIDSELTVIVDAWPNLPEALKAGMVAMVRNSMNPC